MTTNGHGWAKAFLLLALLAQIGFCWAARARSLRGDVDLRAFYTAGAMVRTGHAADLYTYGVVAQTQARLFSGGQTLPFLYPAAAALPFVPLSLLPYEAAFCLFAALNGLLLFAAARLLLPQVRTGLARLMLLSFFPVAIALMQGQLSFVLLVLYALFACFCRRDQPVLAGICLALAMVKFQIALPVALLYLVWKQYGVVTGFLAGSAGMTMISVAVSGWQATRIYGAGLVGMGASTWLAPEAAKVKYGMLSSDMPNLHGLASGMGHALGSGLGTNPALVAVLTVTGSLLVLAWSAHARPSLAVALPAAMLVSYHLQPYDLVLLLVPLCLKSARAKRDSFPLNWSRLNWAGVTLLMVPLAPWLLVHGQTRWFALSVGCVWLSASRAEISGAQQRSGEGLVQILRLPWAKQRVAARAGSVV